MKPEEGYQETLQELASLFRQIKTKADSLKTKIKKDNEELRELIRRSEEAIRRKL